MPARSSAFWPKEDMPEGTVTGASDMLGAKGLALKLAAAYFCSSDMCDVSHE